jgi:bifunctional non-homologous end joining protein LigD
MSLREYRRKRDFSRTAEPRGQRTAAGSGNLYIVHKHAATRLHYDLRLELDGVLKSWAVPKGPSLDPAEKRLAVQVEDHPLEYGSFEGTIPKHEYGGGTVMLWDQGSWEPEGDPAEGLAEGKLSFRLYGEKLRGSWALVRMKGREGGLSKNWLLIKHQDEEAAQESRNPVVEELPLSVLTHRTLEEIAAGKAGADTQPPPGPEPDPGKLSKARKGPLPGSVNPQLATLVDEPPAGDGWLHEIKLDGYRIIAIINDSGIALLSRRGKDWTGKFSEVAEALRNLPVRQAVLDGEIVVLRPDGTTDFQALQEIMRNGRGKMAVFYLFDLLYCNGYDLTRTPLTERKNLLRALVTRMRPVRENIRYSDHIESGGQEVYRHACLLSAEGIVSKQAAAPYEQKRSRSWLKTKCLHRQEMVVGGWTEPGGLRPGFGALLVGYYEDGDLVYAGRVGTGFDRGDLRRLSDKLRRLGQDGSPFRNPPTGADVRGVHWVRPELVVEVAFREWTRENILRQAAFKGLREDKAAGEVVREVPGDGDGIKGSGETGSPVPARKQSRKAVVAGVRLSNPDKILYPEQNISKLALAEFYAAIADFILPYVVHRPLTLLRCPDGRQQSCFYQKHLGESLPAILRTIPIVEKEGTRDYVVIDDVRGLVSLVQLGVLEIHPWGSREDDLEKPDLLIFDLDPGPDVGWPEVVAGARLLRRRLEDLDLKSYVKTSGGKGLHLLVPIRRRTGWQVVKDFAGAVARALVRSRPDLFTAEMKKTKRQERIFIDYLRNDRGATTVAAYSTRARAGAPVSTPIRWDELNRTMTPDRYRVDNLPRRLAALKNDPWPDFFTIRQIITRTMTLG